MDIFLIRGGVIENIVSVASMEWAATAYPGYELRERTADVAQTQIGESIEAKSSVEWVKAAFPEYDLVKKVDVKAGGKLA